MSRIVTVSDFQDGLAYASKQKLLLLPHNLLPCTDGYPTDSIMTEHRWRMYIWNPPEHFIKIGENMKVDPDASPKPTFEEVLEFIDQAHDARLRTEAWLYMKEDINQKIMQEVYGQRSAMAEVNLRLRGGNTPEQDAERDRLIAKHKRYKVWMETATHAQLREFLDNPIDWS